MTRAPVVSSDIASVGYDPVTLDLTVEFVRGNRVFVYRDVPRGVYHGLLVAPSVGGYFAKFIKDRYAYTEVKDAPIP